VSGQPRYCAGALILRADGRIFVQRRAATRKLFPDCWDIVGGHLEPGEDYPAALRREVFEETGWRVRAVLVDLGEVTYTGEDGLVRIERDYLIRVDGDPDAPRLAQHEHVDWRWIVADELAALVPGQRPGDVLARRLIEAGFAAAAKLGLLPPENRTE
jgi:8-oxo-dGTP diphosphatase